MGGDGGKNSEDHNLAQHIQAEDISYIISNKKFNRNPLVLLINERLRLVRLPCCNVFMTANFPISISKVVQHKNCVDKEKGRVPFIPYRAVPAIQISPES